MTASEKQIVEKIFIQVSLSLQLTLTEAQAFHDNLFIHIYAADLLVLATCSTVSFFCFDFFARFFLCHQEKTSEGIFYCHIVGLLTTTWFL